jgi:hypothetical protein
MDALTEIGGTPLEHPPYIPDLAPCDFLKLTTNVCNTFSRSGWSVVRSASLAKGGTLQKRPSPHSISIKFRLGVIR